MGLHYIYSNATGTTLELTDRCRLYRLEVKVNAEEGSVAISSLIVDDPDGDLDLLAFRRLYIYDDLAPLGSQVVFNGYLAERDVTRGPNHTGSGRHWIVSLNDSNWVLSLRVMNGADANRPAETDVARIQWLLTTTELNTVDDSRYVAVTPTVAMDAADYRGQRVLDVIDDCAQQSGKNYFVWYAEDVGQLSLWYDDSNTSTQYTSTLRLSNDLADVDNVTTFAPSKEAVLTRSPQRLNSGVYLPYDGGTVYAQRTTTGNTYIFRDAVMPAENVKTLAAATVRANRYIEELSTEEDTIRTAYECDAEYVNLLMAGMRMEAKFTHLPGYDFFRWLRVLNRTIREIAEYRFEITVELSPQGEIPGVPSFFTHTNLSGCETGPWPEGAPGAGKLLVSFLAQRSASTHDATIVPIGSTALSGCPGGATVPGTEWTFIDGFNVSLGVIGGAQPNSYPITMAWRDSTALDPISVAWGGAGLAGTARPRQHTIAIEGLSGAPTVTATLNNATTGGSVFTSPNIVVPAAGYIFAGFSYVASGPADGSSAPFVMTARSPAVDLTAAYAYGSFAPYSWFGYLRVETAGTYNIVLDRSATPRNPTRPYGWILGFWPD